MYGRATMRQDKKIKCNGCKKMIPIRKIKKVNGGFLCIKCRQKNRKEHREFLNRKIIGVRKRRSKEEIEKENQKQIIKIKNINPTVKMINLCLSKYERQFLYRKHIKEGDSVDEASRKVTNCNSKLKELVKKLRIKGISEEEINRMFKEEFARLCEK